MLIFISSKPLKDGPLSNSHVEKSHVVIILMLLKSHVAKSHVDFYN